MAALGSHQRLKTETITIDARILTFSGIGTYLMDSLTQLAEAPALTLAILLS